MHFRSNPGPNLYKNYSHHSNATQCRIDIDAIVRKISMGAVTYWFLFFLGIYAAMAEESSQLPIDSDTLYPACYNANVFSKGDLSKYDRIVIGDIVKIVKYGTYLVTDDPSANYLHHVYVAYQFKIDSVLLGEGWLKNELYLILVRLFDCTTCNHATGDLILPELPGHELYVKRVNRNSRDIESVIGPIQMDKSYKVIQVDTCGLYGLDAKSESILRSRLPAEAK